MSLSGVFVEIEIYIVTVAHFVLDFFTWIFRHVTCSLEFLSQKLLNLNWELTDVVDFPKDFP